MRNFFDSIGRKGVKIAYWISIVVLLALFVALAVAYVYTLWGWSIWVATTVLLIWIVITIMYIAIAWRWQIEDLMNDYKNNNNVLSGGFAVLFSFAFPFLILLVFSQIGEFVIAKEVIDGIAALIIAAMPAFIALLGVQYTVAIQERNRKEDQRLGAKPFFTVECEGVEMIAGEDGRHVHKIELIITLKNISQNIGIPKKIVSLDDESCKISFRYQPVAQMEEFCRTVTVSSVEPYATRARLAIYYADVYNNLYEMKTEFLFKGKATMPDIQIVSDDVVKE